MELNENLPDDEDVAEKDGLRFYGLSPQKKQAYREEWRRQGQACEPMEVLEVGDLSNQQVLLRKFWRALQISASEGMGDRRYPKVKSVEINPPDIAEELKKSPIRGYIYKGSVFEHHKSAVVVVQIHDRKNDGNPFNGLMFMRREGATDEEYAIGMARLVRGANAALRTFGSERIPNTFTRKDRPVADLK